MITHHKLCIGITVVIALVLLVNSITILSAKKIQYEAENLAGLHGQAANRAEEIKAMAVHTINRNFVIGIIVIVFTFVLMGDLKKLAKQEDTSSGRTEQTKDEALEQANKKLHDMKLMLVQAEKLKSIGQLASGVAHELKNPLGIIIQNVNYLEKKIATKESDITESLTMLKDSVQRANDIIYPLLDFSRAKSLKVQPEDIGVILEESLRLIQGQLKAKKIEVVSEKRSDIPKVLVDKNKIEQVFINLFLNAVQAMEDGGKIFIRSYLKQLDKVGRGVGNRSEDFFALGENAVAVEIQDTGSGIATEDLKKIFESFFTTKSAGKGTGLGLSITKDIITMHRGLINVESQKGEGTKFTITLKITEG